MVNSPGTVNSLGTVDSPGMVDGPDMVGDPGMVASTIRAAGTGSRPRWSEAEVIGRTRTGLGRTGKADRQTNTGRTGRTVVSITSTYKEALNGTDFNRVHKH